MNAGELVPPQDVVGKNLVAVEKLTQRKMLKKHLCNRKPYNRRSLSQQTFSISEISVILRKKEFQQPRDFTSTDSGHEFGLRQTFGRFYFVMKLNNAVFGE